MCMYTADEYMFGNHLVYELFMSQQEEHIYIILFHSVCNLSFNKHQLENFSEKSTF